MATHQSGRLDQAARSRYKGGCTTGVHPRAPPNQREQLNAYARAMATAGRVAAMSSGPYGPEEDAVVLRVDPSIGTVAIAPEVGLGISCRTARRWGTRSPTTRSQRSSYGGAPLCRPRAQVHQTEQALQPWGEPGHRRTFPAAMSDHRVGLEELSRPVDWGLFTEGSGSGV